MDEVAILVEHVLLTSRNGFAACAHEQCDWVDKFPVPRRDSLDPRVPAYIRVAHAQHQLELLEEYGFRLAEDEESRP